MLGVLNTPRYEEHHDMFSSRRDFLRSAALALAAVPVVVPRLAHAHSLSAPIQRSAKAMSATAADDSIQPYSVNTPEEVLADLRRRIAATRLPDSELVPDASQGVQLATIRNLLSYWGSDYDWRKFEAKLSALPQYTTRIDGLEIHFIHVKSRHDNALPLVLTHGWPGSIVEMLDVVGPLTDPTAFGGRPEDAFDLVIPSIPGYGYSGKPTTVGWHAGRIAQAWAELMNRLGYSRYVAQGGDQGAVVTHAMAQIGPAGLLGVHFNFLVSFPPAIAASAFLGVPAPAGISDEEQAALKAVAATFKRGYIAEQGQTPQTIGYALTDTPIGLAAWMLDHDADSYQKISHAFVDGHATGGLTRDHVLDNITLYWLTGTATSAARLYWESGRLQAAVATAGQPPAPPALPAAFTVFPGELYLAPRSWAEKVYPNLSYFNAVDRGGHFAAWEEPQLFSEELRAAFRPLR
jgi:pimeloyl-ACP methyl ester carboxylesterase